MIHDQISISTSLSKKIWYVPNEIGVPLENTPEPHEVAKPVFVLTGVKLAVIPAPVELILVVVLVVLKIIFVLPEVKIEDVLPVLPDDAKGLAPKLVFILLEENVEVEPKGAKPVFPKFP